MGQVTCRGQECGHLCKAKGSQAEGQNNPRATSSDKHQKEDPAQSKHREDGNRERTEERFGTCPNVIPLSLRHSQVSEETAGARIRMDTVRRSQLHPPWQAGDGGAVNR